MSIRPLRVAVIVVVATLSTTASVSAATSLPPNLFIARTTVGGAEGGPTVDRLDPSTGAVATLVDFTSSGQVPGWLVADQESPSIYALASVEVCGKGIGCITVEQHVATIDSQNGAVSETPALANQIDGPMALDPATGSLWALGDFSAEFSSGQRQVIRVNPLTGAEDTVATIPLDQTGTSPAALAVDSKRHVLYLAFTPSVTGTHLFRLDTRTGELTQGPALATALGQLLFDPRGGRLLGITVTAPQELVRLDPKTGVESALLTFVNSNVSFAALDPESQELFTMDSGLLFVTPPSLTVVDLRSLQSTTTQLQTQPQDLVCCIAAQSANPA